FFYEKIFSDDNYIFVCLNKGMKIFDKNFNVVKEMFDFKITCFTYNDNYYVFAGEGLNEMRIVQKNRMRVLASFPYSNMKIKDVKSLFFINSELFFSHQSFISKIKIL
ncbi:hypothetical protein COBT_001048, partial [Conglomerata obtusa]